MTLLGEGWSPKAKPREEDLPRLDPWDKLLLEIMLLRESLMNQPTPVVHVAPQDLSDVVQAVQGLAGPTSQLTAQDIAQAVSEVLIGVQPAESTPEWVERLLEALERIDFRMKATGVVSGGGSSSVTVQNQPGTSLHVLQGQTLDGGNTTTRTSADGATQYVGSWTQTREPGFVRQLTVLSSNVTTGLGGTFVFEYSEDASTATISESRTIGDFSTVRDFDLINAGAYYRVKFTPSRALVGAETVSITTTQRKQDDGAFVRLATQELEEQNAALPSEFAYIKAFDPVTGKSTNVRADRLGALQVNDDSLGITESGSLFVESIRDDIALTFSRDQGALAVSDLLQAVTGNTGTATHDTTEGQVVFATGAAAGRIAYYESTKAAVYEPGHTIRGEQTIQINMLPTGTQTIEWGYGEDNGSGAVLNGIGWGIDATGLYTWRRKAGVLVTQTYQSSFYDPLDGSTASRYRIAGVPVAFDPLGNSLFRTDFEWLGAAPPQYRVMTPEGDFIVVDIEPTVGQITGTTVPEPQLPLFVRVYNGAGGNLQVRSGSWRGGINTSKTILMGQQPDGDYVSAKADGTVFTTTTTLGSSGVFTSDWFDSDGWRSIGLVVKTNVVSASNGLLVEFTDDVEGTQTVRSSRVYTFSADDVAIGFLSVRFPVELDGFRVTYTNGGTAQGNFFLGCDVRTDITELARAGLETQLSATSSANMVRGILAARNAGGTYGNIERGTLGGLDIGIVQQEVELQQKSCSTHRCDMVNVTTGAAQRLDTTQLTDRKYITISNNDATKGLFYGTQSSLSSSSQAISLPAGSSHQQEWDTNLQVWATASSGTINVSLSQTGGTV